MALHHAQHGEVVHLSTLGADGKHGHTTALVKTDTFEAIHLLVHAGLTIPSHRVVGRATLQCLRGSVRVLLAGTPITLQSGDWMYLDRGEEHGIEGIEDAALLLTILFGSRPPRT
jgi:quercetin dioxygenase-like cupin family protein